MKRGNWIEKLILVVSVVERDKIYLKLNFFGNYMNEKNLHYLKLNYLSLKVCDDDVILERRLLTKR